MLRRCAARGHGRIGIFIPQIGEGKPALSRDLYRPLDRPGKRGKPLGNIPAVVQMPLAIGKEPAANLLHRTAVAHGREGIEERQTGPFVVADVAGRHERHPRLTSHRCTPPQAVLVIPFERHLGQRHQPIVKHLTPLSDRRNALGLAVSISHTGIRDRRQWHAREQTLGMGGNIGKREHARVRAAIMRHTVCLARGSGITLSSRGSGIALRQEPTEMGIARAIGRPYDQRHGIYRLQIRADDQLDGCLPVATGLQ